MFGFVLSSYGASPDKLLEQAFQQTASGDLSAAEATYRELSDNTPEVGLPALARFLRLSATNEKLQDFLHSIHTDEKLAPLLKADILVEAGRREDAIDLAWKSVTKQTDVTHLAEFLYRQGEKAEAIGVLTDKPTPSTFLLLLQYPESLALNSERFLNALNATPQSLDVLPEDFLGLIDQQIIRWQESPDYWEEREDYERALQEQHSLFPLFASVMTFHEGHLPEAESLLARITNSSDWVAATRDFHQFRLLKAMGRDRESSQLASRLFANQEPTVDPNQLCQFAYQAWKRSELEQAHSILSQINPSELTSEALATYYHLKLSFAASHEDFPLLLSLLPDYAKVSSFDEQLETLGSIATGVQSKQRLLDEVALSLKSKSDSPILFLLDYELRRQNNKPIEALNALWNYTQLASDQYPAKKLFVTSALQLSATEETTEELSLHAETMAVSLIQSRPFDAEIMRALMDFYQRSNRTEKAAQVSDLVGRDATSSKLLSHCGYILATEGFSEEALSYYNRALAYDPANPLILMNRASCYTRLNRWDEATAFYRQNIENGFAGKPFHLHECLLRLWSIAEHQRREEECLLYLQSLVDQESPRWQTDLLRELVALMTQLRRLDDAIHFHEALVKRFQIEAATFKDIASSYQLIARGLIESGNHDEAGQFLSSSLSEIEEFDEVSSLVAESLASLDLERGLPDVAIHRLHTFAQTDDHPKALDFLYFAARIAEQSRQSDKAERLFTEFLASKSLNFELRASAGRKLARLSSRN